MLDSRMIKKIEDFVSIKPRSIHELAIQLNKNWRTIDRYVKKIEEDFGTLSTRTFREGTRGALKIVYLSSVEKISNSPFQDTLEQEMMRGKNKKDFSAFDIFQHIQDKNKKTTIEKEINENTTNLKELRDLFRRTQKELKIFSGNLSFLNLKKDKIDLFDAIEELIKRNVKIKVICRVDIEGKENIEKMLSLNFKYNQELIEIKHREQPLRAIIFDKKIFRIKEIKEPTGKIKELDKKIFIFYTIKEKEWVEWLSRIFWKMFNNSIGVKKRLEEINKIV
ncbi:MAG: hypothetical protein KKF68_03940 [Nanoarchaeota archaeon]|nr:hypothetical protein [Nanoarchaeota archaeon]